MREEKNLDDLLFGRVRDVRDPGLLLFEPISLEKEKGWEIKWWW
jgi:hypothetical protein